MSDDDKRGDSPEDKKLEAAHEHIIAYMRENGLMGICWLALQKPPHDAAITVANAGRCEELVPRFVVAIQDMEEVCQTWNQVMLQKFLRQIAEVRAVAEAAGDIPTPPATKH